MGRRSLWWSRREAHLSPFPGRRNQHVAVAGAADGSKRDTDGVRAGHSSGSPGKRGSISDAMACEITDRSNRIKVKPPSRGPPRWRSDDFTLYWDTKHKEDNEGKTFVRLYSTVQRKSRARGLRYRGICVLCRTDVAAFLDPTAERAPRRWARHHGKLGVQANPLGLMLQRPSVNLRAHQQCLDYAMGEDMFQDFSKDADTHLDGFPVAAIKTQLKNTQPCAFCKKSGAAVTCAVSSCNNKARSWYHLPCGIKNGTLQVQDGDTKKSYCVKHARDKSDEAGGTSSSSTTTPGGLSSSSTTTPGGLSLIRKRGTGTQTNTPSSSSSGPPAAKKSRFRGKGGAHRREDDDLELLEQLAPHYDVEPNSSSQETVSEDGGENAEAAGRRRQDRQDRPAGADAPSSRERFWIPDELQKGDEKDILVDPVDLDAVHQKVQEKRKERERDAAATGNVKRSPSSSSACPPHASSPASEAPLTPIVDVKPNLGAVAEGHARPSGRSTPNGLNRSLALINAQSAINDAIQQATAETGRLEAELAAEKEASKVAREASAKLKKELEEAKKTASKASDDYEAAKQECKRLMKKRRDLEEGKSRLEAELRSAREKCEKDAANAEVARKADRAVIEDLKRDCQEASRGRDSWKEQHDRLKENYDKVFSVAEKTKAHYHEMKKQRTEYKARLEQLEASHNTPQQTLAAELAKERQQRENLSTLVTNLKESLEEERGKVRAFKELAERM